MRPHVCMVVMMYLRMVMVSTYVTAVQANGQTGSGRFLGHFVVMCRRVVDSALGVMVEGIEKGRGGDSGNFGGWGLRSHEDAPHTHTPYGSAPWAWRGIFFLQKAVGHVQQGKRAGNGWWLSGVWKLKVLRQANHER